MSAFVFSAERNRETCRSVGATPLSRSLATYNGTVTGGVLDPSFVSRVARRGGRPWVVVDFGGGVRTKRRVEGELRESKLFGHAVDDLRHEQ